MRRNSAVEDFVKTTDSAQLRFSLNHREPYEGGPKFGYMYFDRFQSRYTGREHYSYFLAKGELSRSRLRPDGTDVVPAQIR